MCIYTAVGTENHDYCGKPRSSEEMLELHIRENEDFEATNSTCMCNSFKFRKFSLKRFSNDAQSITFYARLRDYKTLKSVFMALQLTHCRNHD